MPAPGGMATASPLDRHHAATPGTHLCAIASVTTLRKSKHQTVILRVGGHPFIRHQSTVFYGDAMVVDALRLDFEIAAGLALAQEKCPSATLKLVQDGLSASPFTRPKIQRFCREHCRRET